MTLNGVACTSIVNTSSTQIICNIPFLASANNANSSLKVINGGPGGGSATSTGFTYYSPVPTMTGNLTATAGQTFTVTGTYFYGTPVVKINNVLYNND